MQSTESDHSPKPPIPRLPWIQASKVQFLPSLWFWEVSPVQTDPQGGEVQEPRARALHEAIQLCELQHGGQQACPVQLPLPGAFMDGFHLN